MSTSNGDAARQPGSSHTAYCPACDRTVEVALTRAPLHGGQANLDDEPNEVCLDFGARCTSTTCPVFGLPRIVLGVRLARSELAGGRLPTRVARCDACGQVGEMRGVDAEHAVCPSCGTLNSLVLLELDDRSLVAISRARV